MNLARFRVAWGGHALAIAGAAVAFAVAHVAWLEPADRARRAVESDREQLRARVVELQAGLQEMERWKREAAPEDGIRARPKRVPPGTVMVPALLESLAGIAAGHGVRTGRIVPSGPAVAETIADAAGNAVVYRKVEFRLRLEAPYRAIGSYLADVEALDQLVVVRSVSLRYEASLAPDVAADVVLWVYGAP